MTVRADIAELLHAGVPESHIARQLHIRTLTVREARKALGLPAPKRGHQPQETTFEDAFRARAVPTDGGHTRWTGSFGGGGVPVVSHSGTRISAYKVAFRLQYGREPRGQVRPGCSVRGCVTGGHLEDQPMRETCTAIFGGVA